MSLREIKSIKEILEFLKLQADLRSEENDEAGILISAADDIDQRCRELEGFEYLTLDHDGRYYWTDKKWKRLSGPFDTKHDALQQGAKPFYGLDACETE